MTRPAPLATPAPGARRPEVRRPALRLPRLVAAGLAAGALALTAGCSTQSPTQTLVPYQPADGVALDSGSVQARDLLIVASAKGGTGVLSGSLINTGTTSIKVSFAQAGTTATGAATSATVDLAPREQKRITSVEIPAVAAAPGALTGLVMTTPSGDAVVQVPVLPPDSFYSTLTPTAPAATAG